MRIKILSLSPLILVSAISIGYAKADSSTRDNGAGATQSFDIPSQPLAQALKQFADQTVLQLAVETSITTGHTSPAVKGRLSSKQALDKLLAGSGLRYEFLNSRTVAVAPVAATTSAQRPFVAQLAQADSTPISAAQSTPGLPPSGPANSELEEVVVTGTRVRGTAPVGSAVSFVQREDIAASGIGSTEQILQLVPSLSGLGLSESSRGNQGGSNNVIGGTAFNLRGLGPTATLTLINGHRMVVSGTGGVAPDPSTVPTTALERAEVLTDGASAIYGSDAVAGVVNLILRRNVERLEVSGRYSVADSYHSYRIGVIGGNSWDTGRFTLSAEANFHTALEGASRSFNRMDLRSFGGTDQSITSCFPGNFTLNGVTYPIPNGPVNSTTWVAGSANKCEPYNKNDIIPKQQRDTAALTFDQGLGDYFSLSGDGMFSHREARIKYAYTPASITVPSSNPYFTLPAGVAMSDLPNCPAPNQTLKCETISYYVGEALGNARFYRATVNTYNAHLNLDAKLPHDWRSQVEFTTGVDRTLSDGYNYNSNGSSGLYTDNSLTTALYSTSVATAFDPYGLRTSQSVIDKIKNYVSGGDTTSVFRNYGLNFDGGLITLPGGMTRAAVGIERREEYWTGRNLLGPIDSPRLVKKFDRSVNSGFAELIVPVLGQGFGGSQRLDFSLAERYEKYSDFGSTSNPKFGVSYAPIESLTLRGTYSTAFHAPGPSVLVGATADTSIYVTNTIDPQNGNVARNTLQINASNPDLKPETSDNFSVGFDLVPTWLPGFKFSSTYFSIKYKNLIQSQFNNPDVLRLESVYANLITRNPTSQQLAAITAKYPLVGSVPAGTIVAIIDGRPNNIGEIDTTGIDFDISYMLPSTRIGKMTLGLAGTKLTKYAQALSSTSGFTDQLDTYGYPVDFKARGSFGWSVPSGWAGNVFVNYVDSYTDPAQPITASYYKVASWTTFDLGLAYNIGKDKGLLSETNIALNVMNAFDRDPPFLNRASFSLNSGGYDPQQASALGREIALTVGKKF